MAKTRIPIPAADRELAERRKRAELLKTPVAEILPMRTVNTLEEHAEIIYVGELVRWTAEELAEFPNFGEKTVADIQLALKPLRLELASCDGVS